MSSQDMRNILQFESALQVGDTVEIRWTNNFGYYAAKAEVIRINKSSVRARLIEQAQRADYVPGRELNIPRAWNRTWSASNGVFPVTETF